MQEHTHALVTLEHGHLHVHGKTLAGRINQSLALFITDRVGTMWAAYLFTFLALTSLPQAVGAVAHGDLVTGTSWLSQSFIQLVLLPIIMVGQRVAAAADDARARADHDTITLLYAINTQQLDEHKVMVELLEILKKAQV